MKIFSIILMFIGFYIIAGTAGYSDAHPEMELAQINLQLLLGISLFANGFLLYGKDR